MRFLWALNPNRILPPEIRDLLREDSKWAWILFGIAGVSALVEAATLANFLFLGNAVFDQGISSKLGGLIGERVFAGHSRQVLLATLSSTFIALVILRFTLGLAYSYLGSMWSSRITRRLHKKIMQKIVSSPMEMFDEHQLGEIVYGLLSAPTGAFAALGSVTGLMSAIILISTLGVMLLIISPWLLLTAFLIAVLWFVTIVRSLQKRVQLHSFQRYTQQSIGMNIATDTINGIRDIRSLAAEDKWVGEFSSVVDLWETARVRMGILGSLPTSALQALLQIAFAGGIIFAAFVLSSGDLEAQLPVIGVFAYGLFRMYPAIGQVSGAWIGISQAIPSLKAAAEWTGLPEDPLGGGTQEAPSQLSAIRFQGVSFSYDETSPVLIDADFCIKANEITAIVGTSGAGKSTIVDLLLKFRSPKQGTVWLGDQDLNDVVRSSWLGQVALVRQDVFLFAGTVRDNLLAYKPDATDEELTLACRRAGALEFIDAMPERMETRVSERGASLSGGQRQRIAIARALLRNSEVLILDEAMSAVDGETEAQLLQSLVSGSANQTIVLISHRLTTVQYADYIIVLDGGRVVEQGTHADLIAGHGRYRELFSTQAGEEPVVLSDVGRG